MTWCLEHKDTDGTCAACADRQIAALQYEVDSLRDALAAGPARLRAMSRDYDRAMASSHGASRERAIVRAADLINAALHVEAAQEKAMGETEGEG